MLLSNLNLLATAPGGVARLRELILTLAVQGKLVAQDARDEPASELLKQIRAEKDRLIAAKKLKREKDEPALTDDALPFDLPASWSWVALGEVIDIVRGITFPASQKTREAALGRIACLRTSNVQQTIEWEDLLFVDRSFMGREDQLIQHHDIVMSMANSRELVGKVALIDEIPHAEATFGGFLGVLRPRKIEPLYAMAVLRTPYARSLLIDSSSQTTNIANVSLAKLRPLPFPLPPEAEQSRIVTRVEELMRLCDALEAKGRLEAAQHAQLVTTLLGTLTESDTPERLAENWHRLATHFDLLLDRPQAVDALEQTILQLAVRGLLVPQDPTDEPASALLKKIRLEKDRLIAAGQIKRDKPLAAIGEEEQPFGLPVGWEWVPIETLANVGSGTTPSRENAAFFVGGSIPWVTSGETGKLFIGETAQHVTELALAQTSLSVYPKGTLIVAMYGQGKTRGQVSELCIEATTNQACAAIVLVESAVAHRCFVKLVFEKSYDEMRELSAGGAQPNLNVGKIKATLIPLPPLPEQSRIVTRVAQLRRLCADLRQRLAASQSTQAQLAEALVQEVA
jgi:type I restriction enzyme S subunit